MAVGFQTNVGIAAGLCRELPEPIDRSSLTQRAWRVRDVQVQSSLLTQVGDIHSFR
ncbi:hypothetical protein D3C85_1620850 [compost metagenome]